MTKKIVLRFVPGRQTRRLALCDVYWGRRLVGQERVTHAGGAVFPPPVYQYLRWDLAVPWGDEPVSRGSSPLEVPPECDDDGVGFICPGFGTIDEFSQSLRDHPFGVSREVKKCRNI
jgi:hypothetical protein